MKKIQSNGSNPLVLRHFFQHDLNWRKIHMVDAYGNTALHLSRCGVEINALCENNADVNKKNYIGETPIFSHLHCPDEDITVLNYMGDKSYTSTTTWLKICVKNIGVLCSYGADINARDCKGRTPYDRCKNDKLRSIIYKFGGRSQEENNNV